MNPIKETIKQHGQYVVKYEDPNIPVFCASKIAIGLAWPTAEKDGYFCVVADEVAKPLVPGVEHRPITVLVEEEHALLPALFDALGEQVRKCNCTTIYAQFNPAVVHKPGFDGTNKAFVMAFNDYRAKRATLALLSLQPPLISDWLVGILTVQKWGSGGALSIPRDFIMHSQLKAMNAKEHRKDIERDRFPAITALVCAMTPFVSAIVQRGAGLRNVVPSKYVW